MIILHKNNVGNILQLKHQNQKVIGLSHAFGSTLTFCAIYCKLIKTLKIFLLSYSSDQLYTSF